MKTSLGRRLNDLELKLSQKAGWSLYLELKNARHVIFHICQFLELNNARPSSSTFTNFLS